MMCLRLLMVMLIIISPSVSHARQVKETTTTDHVRKLKEAVRDDNRRFSSKKEFQVPSAAKAEVSEYKNTSEKSNKTAIEIFFNTRKVSKNGDTAMISRAITDSTAKIQSRNELKEDNISKHNGFVAFSADYHPPKGHPGRNN